MYIVVLENICVYIFFIRTFLYYACHFPGCFLFCKIWLTWTIMLLLLQAPFGLHTLVEIIETAGQWFSITLWNGSFTYKKKTLWNGCLAFSSLFSLVPKYANLSWSVGIVADSSAYDQSKRLRTGGDYTHTGYSSPSPFHPPPAPVWGPHG